MVELTQKERLQPSLLDRLTDDEPDKKVESRDKRVLSVQKIRQCVLRDMSWLLNTSNLAAVQNLDEYPNVKQSVVNYGMPDLAGIVAASADVLALERILCQVIGDFEPRILQNTVKVRVEASDDEMDLNAMTFEIEGDLWAQPMPQRLYLKTIIDMDMKSVDVEEING